MKTQSYIHMSFYVRYRYVVQVAQSNIKHLTLQDEATPLHLAASKGHHEVCDVLLKSGADVHSRDSVGRNVKY